MALMVFDHVREFFYYPYQVSDPMSLDTTSTELFFTRLMTHLCAPIFVFLAGVSAFLYGYTRKSTQSHLSWYLFKRGILLIALEISVVNFGWIFSWDMVYLQVIWAIGCSMIALSLLLWLPWHTQIAVGLVLIGGHNLLDSIHFDSHSPLHLIWAILHDRNVIDITDSITIRTSYPILPWIGVITLGYQFGKIMIPTFDPDLRKKILLITGITGLILFLIVRMMQVGDPSLWNMHNDLLILTQSFLNVTKYPPSLAFLSLTLGIGMLLLYLFETLILTLFQPLKLLGKHPLVFYIFHIYILHFVYLLFRHYHGITDKTHYAFESVPQIWLMAIVMNILFYGVIKFYDTFKKNRLTR